jgi:hypothetical protein
MVIKDSSRSQDNGRHGEALNRVVDLLGQAGWDVQHEPVGADGRRSDLLVRKGGWSYIVEMKVGSEGRADRLIPLWSQAFLQAHRLAAGGRHAPLAIVAAPYIRSDVADQIVEFAERNAPDGAIGVLDFHGLRLFRGPGLDGLNGEGIQPSLLPRGVRDGADLFSDLNQWMLKVLLAPDLPADLLSAPRGEYRNASQLAQAAQVSVMSAFRFVQQLQKEGHLHESSRHVQLVRRPELFRRWQASVLKPAREVPMRLLLRGDLQKELRRMLANGRACLALFAAADALGLGFVQGVPPHVYVPLIAAANLAAWKRLVPAEPGEAPDLILRQPGAREAVFRALVRPNDLPSSDVIQVWLDVASHPARGREQADVIFNRVIQPRLLRGAAHE